jgi:hypothetical protein
VGVSERSKGTSRFFLFGMGNRRKLIYRAGKLMDAFTGEVLRRWKVISEAIEPAEYRVRTPLTANNNGIPEPDNLGQALHLASLFVDASHPLVSKVLAAVREFQQQTAIPHAWHAAEMFLYLLERTA